MHDGHMIYNKMSKVGAKIATEAFMKDIEGQTAESKGTCLEESATSWTKDKVVYTYKCGDE